MHDDAHDTQLLKGVLVLILLRLLDQRESYGYELVGRVHAAGLTGVAEGSVYPALARLEREGYLDSEMVTTPSGPPRKYFRLSASGVDFMPRPNVGMEIVGRRGGRAARRRRIATGGRGMSGLRSELRLHQINRRLIRRNMPLVERHGIIRDLRANLKDAAQQIGEQSALDRLGDPDDLAAEYVSTSHRGRPRIRTGVLAAAWTLIILVTVSLVRVPTFGMIDTFDSHTGATTWHVQWWRLGAMSGDTTSDTLFEATVNSYGYGLAVAAAFILGARLWRLGRHADHHPTSTTPA